MIINHLQCAAIQMAMLVSLKMTRINQMLESGEAKTSSSPSESPHNKQGFSQFLA